MNVLKHICGGGGRYMRRCFAWLTAMVIVFAAALNTTVFTAPRAEIAPLDTELTLDANGTDGYTGDYVLIYNPSLSATAAASTGCLEGLIQTQTDSADRFTAECDDAPYILDVDTDVNSRGGEAAFSPNADERASFGVGSSKYFYVDSVYSPASSNYLPFVCAAVGAYCYVWTVASTVANGYPITDIDSGYAFSLATEFDAQYTRLCSAFGGMTNADWTAGDGKLHILRYNIDDGWQLGDSYVAGYFSRTAADCSLLPTIHIDTYPTMYYQRSDGEEVYRIENAFRPLVHEYQHLVNYARTDGMEDWINEVMSAAAEEICYPGECIVGRMSTWLGQSVTDAEGNWLYPNEAEYRSDNAVHNGASMYLWDGSSDDILSYYSRAALYGQYLSTQFGSGVFKRIMTYYASGYSLSSSVYKASGFSLTNITKLFNIALVVNDLYQDYGEYGFYAGDNYNPSDFGGLASPYDLLCPIVFTGDDCTLYGGAAICIKPVDGVYFPPADASGSLQYFGITTAMVYDVTFFDMEGFAISTCTVYEGGAACAPTAPQYEGYTFVMWDVSFDCVHSDTNVCALYVPSSQVVVGDADCNGGIDFEDATYLYATLVGSEEKPQLAFFINADANINGIIDFGDVTSVCSALVTG